MVRRVLNDIVTLLDKKVPYDLKVHFFIYEIFF